MSAYVEVTDVLQRYFDGLYACDVEQLRDVFHPGAIYATADEEPLLVRSVQEYMAVVSRREASATRGEERRDFIDDIEFAGANTARARVRCSIGARDFVDFLTLIRTDGRGRIMAKIFQIIDTERTDSCPT